MICLILAGGFGKRLWPLTEDMAKPLLVVDDEEIVTSLVKKIPKSIPIYLSTNSRFEGDFEEWRKKVRRHIEIFVEDARDEKEKLGAMGAVSYFLKTSGIEDDLLLLGGDNLFSFELAEFIDEYQGKPLVAVHDIKDKEKAKRYGVVRLSGKRIVGFEEKPEHPSSTLISTACYIFPQKTFPRIHEFCATRRDNLGEFISHLASKEEVCAFVFRQAWFDIGSFESYIEAHASMHANQFPPSVIFEGKCDIKGKVYLGENCVISNSHIEDSIVFENSVVEESRLVRCIVGRGSTIRGATLNDQIVKG